MLKSPCPLLAPTASVYYIICIIVLLRKLQVSYNVNYVKYSLRHRCHRFFEQVCEEVVILKAVGTHPHRPSASATF